MSRIKKYLLVVLLFIASISLGITASDNVSAEGQGWGGGNSGSHSPSTGGGGGGGSGKCDNYYANGSMHAGSGLNAGCMGYSWIFFKATGPTKVVNGKTVGEEMYFRPYLPYGGVATPYISGICAGSDNKGNRLGFWHLGRNGSGWEAKGIFNTDNHWENGKNGEEVAWGKNDKNGMFPYAFRLYNTSKRCDRDSHLCALGHMATWSYDFINGKYRYRWKASDFGDPYRVQHAFDGDLLSDRPTNVSGSYVYGAQRLYKKINNVNVEIYRSYRIASDAEVFEEYKEAWRIEHGGETEYPGTGWPGDLYAFCSWENFPEYTLTAKSIDRSGNSLSSVSGLGNKSSGKVRERRTASVTRGTNSQYIFDGWKLVANSGEYITTTNTNSSSYVSGSASPKETFNIKSINDDTTVYAVYHKTSLTLKAIDSRGNSLSDIIGNVSATGFTAGGEAHATRGTDSRYIFLGFKMASNAAATVNEPFITTTSTSQAYYVSGTDTAESAKETFHVKNLSDEVVVYAVYEEKSSFLGQIVLSENGTQKASVGYSDTTVPTVTYEISNCPSPSGCKVTFTHYFQRKSGDKSVTYSISRSSNYYVSSKNLGIEPKTLVSNATESFSGVNNNTGKQVYRDPDPGELTLMPGQVVCETLTFKPYVWKNDSTTLKLCASALGNAQPDDPTYPGDPNNPWDDPNGDSDNLNGASAFLRLEVKNESVSRYNTYRKVVYAKPNDKVKYRTTYTPTLQYTYYLKPQQMQINGGTVYPRSRINTDSTLQAMFDSNKAGSMKKWNNAFYVSGDLFSNENNYTLGDFVKKNQETSSYTIRNTSVGKEIKEKAKTNQTDGVSTTPSQVSFKSNGSDKSNLGNVITTSKESDAAVRVPYNFNIDTCMKKSSLDSECAGSDLGVYEAGSRKDFYFDVKVEKKANPETTNSTSESYATVVPKATTKIIVYKGGVKDSGMVSGDICSNYYRLNNDGVNCSYSVIQEWEGANALNVNSTMEGEKKALPATFDVPDIEAGASYCVASAVYPASSADVTAANYASNSTGWADTEGNHMWRVSPSVCFTVGKKPTFQVWGGSLYGGEDVIVSSTAKNSLTPNLSGGTTSLTGGNVIVFSSWVEQIVVAKGKVDKLASGASTGITSKNVAGGGSSENPENFCKYRTVLSLANRGSGLCQDGAGNNTGKTGDSGIIVKNSRDVIAKLVPDDATHIDATHINSGTYYSGNGDLWGTNTINVSEDIYINGNIIYHNGPYTTLSEIPKMIIYTTKDIHVACGVTRVDAVLLAGGTVYTCDSYGGRDSTERANIDSRAGQLTINGAILTKGLELGRTYGMGTGIYSKIPAEIINYDSSIILWAKDKTDTEDFKKMHQVYINEIAPRY